MSFIWCRIEPNIDTDFGAESNRLPTFILVRKQPKILVRFRTFRLVRNQIKFGV